MIWSAYSERQPDGSWRIVRTELRAEPMSEKSMEGRLAELEATLREEISQRIRAHHRFEHRVSYIERNCLLPMVGLQIDAPGSWRAGLRRWIFRLMFPH